MIFLILVWYKCRQAKREKMELEFAFFQRVEGIMLKMQNVFNDSKYMAVPVTAPIMKAASNLTPKTV